MNIRRKLRAHTEVHTGPLNDILFILLLFFLIASTLANPNLVRVNNPKGDKDSKAKQDLVITIDKDHNFFIGPTAVPRNILDSMVVDAIAKAKKNTDTPNIAINADTAAYYGEVFNLSRLIKRSGAKPFEQVNRNK
jgi:biopolymer transport protein ExbD